jgi:hypothetical protein
MSHSPTIANIAVALCGFQAKLHHVKKGKAGYNYAYADLSQVLTEIRPLMEAHHLSISQTLGYTDAGYNTLQTVLIHNSGEFISGTCIIPKIESKSMNVAQAMGASISYFRRYSLMSILGIATEDNEAASPQQPNQGYSQR